MTKLKKNSSNSSMKNLTGNTSSQISPALHWCFTLNNYTMKDVEDISSNSSIKSYIFQEEEGEEKTPHLQGYVCFKKKLRPKGLFTDRIHWEKCRNVKASIAYCQKGEGRIGEVYHSPDIRIIKPLKLITPDKWWQAHILTLIDGEPSDRDIYWFWEPDGGMGKSAFCKYLCVKHHGLILSGKASDMKYGIIKYIEKHGVYPELVIFDVPRSSLEFISYQGMEEVKNGLFFSSKYESDMVIGNPPHLLVFANSEPDYCKLSEDRWQVCRLVDEEEP